MDKSLGLVRRTFSIIETNQNCTFFSAVKESSKSQKMSFENKRHCFSCKLDSEQLMKKNKKLKTCSFCKIAQYCGVECQRRDWCDNHKVLCIEGFKDQHDLGEKAKKILIEKGHDVDRSSLQVCIVLYTSESLITSVS